MVYICIELRARAVMVDLWCFAHRRGALCIYYSEHVGRVVAKILFLELKLIVRRLLLLF